MACRGILLALTDEQASRFLAASSDDELVELMREVEDAWDEDFVQPTDKAWDFIHRCLSDGTTNTEGGTYPLNRSILGGQQLYHGDDYVMAFVSAPEVQDVAGAIVTVTESWFRERFSRFRDTYSPQIFLQGEGYEQMLAYAWEYMGFVGEFYQRAAQAKRAVIFTVDQ